MRVNMPHIKLKYAFGCRRPFEGFVCAITLGQFHRCVKRGIINRFKNLSVEDAGFFAMEWNIHHHKNVGQALHANPDRAVAQIARSGFICGVVINIDDLVQIVNDEGGYAFEFGEVK